MHRTQMCTYVRCNVMQSYIRCDVYVCTQICTYVRCNVMQSYIPCDICITLYMYNHSCIHTHNMASMHRGSIIVVNALIFSFVLLCMHTYIHTHTWHTHRHPGPITIFCALIYDSFVWWASSLARKSMCAYVYTNDFCLCTDILLCTPLYMNLYARMRICVYAWMIIRIYIICASLYA